MKSISNLHDLVAEKHRLQQKLSLLKRDMNGEITEIKERLKPVSKLLGMFGGGSDSDSPKQSLLSMGAGLGIDLLVGPRLAKAGRIARTVVPPLLKRLTSAVISRFKKKK